MAVRVAADARITGKDGDDAERHEDVYLPGARPGDEDEGPYDFVYPRVGRLIRIQRKVKGMPVMQAAAEELDGILNWVAAGFGPDAWEHIQERLDDVETEDAPGDLLDEEHLVKLYYLLNEVKTGRPTTSSNGASRQPWRKDQTAAPSPPGSVSES